MANTIFLLQGQLTTATSNYYQPLVIGASRPLAIQASVNGTGSVTATVIIQVSNNPASGWIQLAEIDLSGTTTATDGASFSFAFKYVRAILTVISGTNASVDVILED